MRLIGYMRTSTKKQNFGQQERHFRQYGLETIPIYRDHGYSGQIPADRRPGLSAALAALSAGNADRLVVSSYCRLSRADYDENDLRFRVICLSDL